MKAKTHKNGKLNKMGMIPSDDRKEILISSIIRNTVEEIGNRFFDQIIKKYPEEVKTIIDFNMKENGWTELAAIREIKDFWIRTDLTKLIKIGKIEKVKNGTKAKDAIHYVN